MQILYGQRGIYDYIKMSEEYRVCSKALSEAYEKLKEKLQPQTEIWQLFKNFENAFDALQSEETGILYAEGFKFGLLIGIEAGESKFEE